MRENLDIGRPSQVQLILDRRLSQRTPGKFRTRVIPAGVVPSLHVDYKNTRVKQYHKQGRALRTETTIKKTRDFGIGKSLQNLPRYDVLKGLPPPNWHPLSSSLKMTPCEFQSLDLAGWFRLKWWNVARESAIA